MAVSHRNLIAFITVAESETFAEAAEKLCLTQPALSTSIKKMEEQLGGRLFNRTTRRVELTPEGQQLLPSAKRLATDWEETFSDLELLFSMQKGTLTLAAMPSFAESELPNLLKDFCASWPNIKIRLHDVVMEDVIERVINGKVELGFTFEPEGYEGIEFLPMAIDRFVAVVNESHPLAQRDTVSWQTILNDNFIALNRESAVRRWTEEEAKHLGMTLSIIAETGQLGSLGMLIAKGLGVSIVPAICTDQMRAKALVCIPLQDGNLAKPVGLIKRTRSALSTPAENLWDMCQKKWE